jgi:hypothetical protein
VTMVAVLHHLDREDTLSAVRRLVAPSGRFLVVGIAQLGSPRELPLDVTSAVLNPIMELVKHPRGVSGVYHRRLGRNGRRCR